MTDRNNPASVVLAFVERINAHDVDGITALLPPDHVFIDSQGTVFRGRDTLRAGWVAYLKMFPDYSISYSDALSKGNTVLMYGMARGTYAVGAALPAENHWEMPAAWRARVEDGLIAEWQVYADNSRVIEIMKAEG